MIRCILAFAALLATAPPAIEAQELKRLDGIAELKTWFNAGKGHPRLIFLLSPT